jgi:energy-coupling factor transporter ATP-binding protein EcfA2
MHRAQAVPEFVTKIVQIFDCKVARHGNMMVGKTGSGKTTAWKCLQCTLGKLRKEHPDDERFQKVCVSMCTFASSCLAGRLQACGVQRGTCACSHANHV